MTTLTRSMHPSAGDTSPLAEFTGNVSHCWRCSHCKWVPTPKSHEFAHACPSVQWGSFHAYSAGGKMSSAYALAHGEATCTDAALESIYACTMCGACDTACKSNNGEIVEPLSVLYALREHVADDGHSLPTHVAMIDSLQRHGNAGGHPREARSDWCRGLGLKNALETPVEVLLHIGCENAFDEGSWPELKAIVALLQKAGVSFGIAYDREAATGEAAFDLGFRKEARALAEAMGQLIASAAPAVVVTCSASSYAGIRNIWPRLGAAAPGCPVVHVTDYVERLIDAGQLTLEGRFDGTVTYHDPCKLGRLSEPYVPSNAPWTKVLNTMSVRDGRKPILFGNDGLYEAPRRLLARVRGLKLVEMERNCVASYCCGAAGGAKEAFPAFAAFAANHRLAEARATGAAVVATACGGCRRHLGQVAAEGEVGLAVKGVFELLADSAAPSRTSGAGA